MCAIGLFTNAFADSVKTAGAFPDVPADAEYAEAVKVLAEKKIILGDANGNFNPNETVTRAAMAAIICRMMGAESEAQTMKDEVFADVPSDYWAVGYIAKAAELGIIGGYGDGKFGPNNEVTCTQAVVMVVRALGFEQDAVANGGYPDGYIKIANQVGITENIQTISSAAASRSTIALLTFNALCLG